MEIPEGESSMAAMITEQGELEPVWLENALIVGADLRLEFPNEIDANHYYNGFSDEDFTVQWSNYGNFPHQNEVLLVTQKKKLVLWSPNLKSSLPTIKTRMVCW